MPAKAMLFDQRVKTLHDFGSAPHNFISFNPQGRLFALAGFGNLAGKTDIYDRRTLAKITTIDAPNTSHCEWSPDGRFLLTATLSPRLRVDNGIKIWHCTGPLMHIQNIDELYQTSWRPTPVDAVAPFGQTIPVAPPPSEDAQNYDAAKKATPIKPAGAYRPPGARGLATPAIFKREDEGGAPSNGTATPPRSYGRTVPGAAPGQGAPNGSQAGGRRHIPGAPHPSGQDNGEKKANRSKRKGKREGEEGTPNERPNRERNSNRIRSPRASPPPDGMTNGHAKGGKRKEKQIHLPEPVVEITLPPPPVEVEPETPGDSALDQTAKRVRNLNKKVSSGSPPLTIRILRHDICIKLKAIEELKEKLKRGERLETTQFKKIEGEVAIRAELSSLGGAAIIS